VILGRKRSANQERGRGKPFTKDKGQPEGDRKRMSHHLVINTWGNKGTGEQLKS